MAKAAKDTFKHWEATLVEGIDECPVSGEARGAMLDSQPLADYYLAGAIALETAKIRSLFEPREAGDLLHLIIHRVDAMAGRKDRMMSDLVRALIARIEATVTLGTNRMAHDEVVAGILERLGIDRCEATRPLMSELLFRHHLGEPLALGVPHWWHRFHSKYALAPEPITPAPELGPSPPRATRPLRSRRRAELF